MVHVALKLRDDILSHILNMMDLTLVKKFEPDSLYMFLNLMIGGQSLLEQDVNGDDSEGRDESVRRCRILNLAQDLMYTVSGEKHLTPKHIGLANTLHQSTRSKELVNCFTMQDILHATGMYCVWIQLWLREHCKIWMTVEL